MSSATSCSPPTHLSPKEQVTSVSLQNVLNPNAEAFDGFSYLSLLDNGSSPESDRGGVSWQQEHSEIIISTKLNSDSEIPFTSPLANGFEESGFFIPQVTNTSPVSSETSPNMANGPSHTLSDDIKLEDLSREELKSLIKHQLEYYFSWENLASDTYLKSQMDKDQYVPIWTVANFNQIKKLTTDLSLVKEALKESRSLQVDDSGDKVRANNYMKRCIVILREVPESTTKEEVEELFTGEGCPKWTSCEFAHQNHWYIHFESEEDAQKAYRFLREVVRTFKGKPIMARIKAKPLHSSSSYFPAKNGTRTTPQPTATVVETPPVYQSRTFQYTAVPTVYNGQQPLYFPAGVIPQWNPPQTFYPEPSLAGFVTNGFGQTTFTKAQVPNSVLHHQHSGHSIIRPRNMNKAFNRDTLDKNDRDNSSIRNRTQSANGTVTPVNNRNFGYRPRPSDNDDSQSRRNPRLRRRRGSSDDIRNWRQSPTQQNHTTGSKDDLKLDLAPSQFPPLPTSPNNSSGEERITKSAPSSPTQKISSPKEPQTPPPPPPPVPVEKHVVPPLSLPLPTPLSLSSNGTSSSNETTQQAENRSPDNSGKLSYAQIAQRTPSKLSPTKSPK